MNKERAFDIYNKNYYNENQTLYKSNKLVLQANNVYCLVGCNGLGKSTILHQMIYDHSNSLNKTATDINSIINPNPFMGNLIKDKEDYKEFYILLNSQTLPTRYQVEDNDVYSIFGNFISTGENTIHNLSPSLKSIFNVVKTLKDKEVYILLDDLDVGVSIDVLIELSQVINRLELLLKDLNINYYIVITANSYELAKRFKCIDTITMQDITFKDYEEYAKYVYDTRKYKDTRDKVNQNGKSNIDENNK